MGKAFLKNTADLLQKKHKRKQWQKIMISLSLVVALLTSCLLIHPAITMSRQATCGQEEHTHTEKCYEKKLICNKEEQSISESSETEGEESVEAHTHSDACYENVLICGKQEHTHSEACYPKEEEKKEEVAANTEEEKSEDKDVKSEDQEDKAEEKTEDTEKAEARTLKVDQADYTVEVDCPAEANIPKDAKLNVREIKTGTAEYNGYYEKAQKAVASGDETDISFARFFDISFEVDGKEIEPEAKVEVKITYDDKVEVPEKGKVKSVHFGNKTEVLDVKTNEKNGKMDEVKFDADSFSVYAIVGTEKGTENVNKPLEFDGKDYKITLTYDADAGIPAGVTLDAKEITGDDAKTYADKASEKLNAEVAESRFFDIHILDKDGNKIQPKKAVTIKISYDKPFEVGKDEKIQQVHFKDSSSSANAPRKLLKAAPAKGNNNDNIEVLDVKADGEENVSSVEFTQDSFSVTGTVVTALSTGWPSSEGTYALIIKAANGKYYAVRSITTGSTRDESYAPIGSLTEVDYDSSTSKVTFPDMDDSSDLVNYEWEYSNSTKNNWKCLSNGNGQYIDPTSSSGIGNDLETVRRTTNGNIYDQTSGYWSTTYYYFLTANTNTLRLSASTGSESPNVPTNAVQVFFANQFEAKKSNGGTPDDPDTPDVDLGAPATSKTLKSNNNGTYDLSLSVTGKSQAQQSRSKADIIIVFDRSGSMQRTDAGNGNRRDTVAISATKALADTLLKNNTSKYPDTVQIGIISFSNSANTVLELTSNKETIDDRISGGYLGAQYNTGTNWEDALYDANNITAREGAKKYVIFVSDGNPTYSRTHGDGYENTSTIRTCYNDAKDDAKAIVDSGAEFYTIGVFGNVNRMTGLTAYAYSGNDIGTYPSGHYQTASNQTQLTQAFQNIINEINKNFAFTDVSLTDGITDLTSTTAINDGTAGNFTYAAKNTDGTDANIPEWVKVARYNSSTKQVEWNLGNNVLPDGVTYTVSFTVWPTQQAYDVVAALQNGTITWKDPNARVNGQTINWDYFVIEGSEGNYSYKYKTNNKQEVKYKQITSSDGTTTTSEEKTSQIPSDPLPAMPLDKTTITVQKNFEGGNPPEKEELKLGLTQDGKSFIDNLNLDKTNNTTVSGTAHIAPGLITKDGTVLEYGHDYLFTEAGTAADKWTLSTVTYHPMVIGTELKMLQEVKSTDAHDYVIKKVDGSSGYYRVIPNDPSTIYATNTIKTVNIRLKKVDSEDPTKELTGAEFTLTYGNPSNNASATTGISDGKIIFGNQSDVDITGLPIGTYTLTETKAPDGYIVNNTGKTLEITADGVKYGEQTISPDANGVFVITITNKAGQALPMTGGSGTLPYTLGGLLLICAAALMYGFIMRRRGRRLN